MGFRQLYKNILHLNLSIMGLFCCLSLIFVGAYCYFDYQRYLISYKRTQQTELEAAQEKIIFNIDNLKKLSALTANRITGWLGDAQRIQHILTSTSSLLPDAEFLKLHKVTYEQFSKLHSLITRFGIVPLSSDTSPLNALQESGTSIFFDQNSVRSKTSVFNQDGKLDGILEIHVTSSHFKEILKIGPTLSWVSGPGVVILKNNPFPIYGKSPERPWEYFLKHATYYSIFFLFMMFSLIFIVLGFSYFRSQIKKNFQEEVKTLKIKLCELRVMPESCV